MGEFVAKRSVARLLLLFFGAVLFVVGSAWLTWRGVVPGWKYWAVAAGMPFFGACAIAIASMFFASGPEVVVGPHGILWRRWTGDFVPWQAMTDLRGVQVANQKMLAISLRDPEAYPLRGIQGRLQGTNRAMMGGGDVFVTLQGTDRRFDALLDAVAHFAPPGLVR